MEKKPRLIGCYLLIVLGEPLCEDHKERILQKVAKGLLSWDTQLTECDLKHMESVLRNIAVNKNASLDNEILVQHSTDKMAVEVLLNPQLFTLKQCLKNLLIAPTGHKHIIHAGYSFTGTGSWMLQDGIFRFQDFADAFEDKDVENFLKSCSSGSITIHLHCAPVGEWITTNFQNQKFSKLANVQLNPADSSLGVQGAAALLDFFEATLKSLDIENEMLTTPIVGNIRFNRPTLYVFPSGQGDCSLFGVTGFTMLIDGGFTPLPCFWKFVRHLERLDSIMVTRLNESNLWGVSSFLKKKVLQPIYPHIGYVFCNITEGKVSPTDEMQKDRNELLVSVIDVGQKLLGDLKHVGISPHQCLREPCISPLTLYHKVGHGTLDMFVLSPPRESRILRDFLQHWSTNKESFSFVRTNSASQPGQDIAIPISNIMSICCLLIWRPAEPNENIVRMLFPGSAPQSRIFEGLEKIKHLDVLCYQSCSRSSLRPMVIEKPKPKSVLDSNNIQQQARLRSVSPLQRKIKSAYPKQPSVDSNKGDSSESLSSPLHKKLQQPKPQTKKELIDNKKAQEAAERKVKKEEKAKKVEKISKEEKVAQKSPVKKLKPKTTQSKAVSKEKAKEKKPSQKAVDHKEKYVAEKVIDNKEIDLLEEEKKDSEKESPQPSPKKRLLTEEGEEIIEITMSDEQTLEILERDTQEKKIDGQDLQAYEEEKKDSEKSSLQTSPKKYPLPDHVKDEMEPDSLESYEHDGHADISKDSLEPSEDETTFPESRVSATMRDESKDETSLTEQELDVSEKESHYKDVSKDEAKQIKEKQYEEAKEVDISDIERKEQVPEPKEIAEKGLLVESELDKQKESRSESSEEAITIIEQADQEAKEKEHLEKAVEKEDDYTKISDLTAEEISSISSSQIQEEKFLPEEKKVCDELIDRSAIETVSSVDIEKKEALVKDAEVERLSEKDVEQEIQAEEQIDEKLLEKEAKDVELISEKPTLLEDISAEKEIEEVEAKKDSLLETEEDILRKPVVEESAIKEKEPQIEDIIDYHKEEIKIEEMKEKIVSLEEVDLRQKTERKDSKVSETLDQQREEGIIEEIREAEMIGAKIDEQKRKSMSEETQQVIETREDYEIEKKEIIKEEVGEVIIPKTIEESEKEKIEIEQKDLEDKERRMEIKEEIESIVKGDAEVLVSEEKEEKPAEEKIEKKDEKRDVEVIVKKEAEKVEAASLEVLKSEKLEEKEITREMEMAKEEI
ncbi:Microtubule-associated protein futsch-like protein, partial [Dinothrombium tinctorium]